MLNTEKLTRALSNLEEDTVIEMLNAVMADGGGEAAQAVKACQDAMIAVGDRFDAEEYFVADLIYAGEIMTAAMDILRPALATNSGGTSGRMILCTVKGDLHDIGKNIVRTILEAGGFEVIDLGIDVSPAVIVETAKKEGVTIVGLSGVLTLAIDAMKDTVDAFADAGTRDDVRIIVGGAPINESVFATIGSDAWAYNPQDTFEICKNWAAE